MIHLNLAIGENEVELLKFYTTNEVCEYLQSFKKNNHIWLAADEGEVEREEILITENLEVLLDSIKNGYFNLLWNSPQNFYIQAHDTYEDAYRVALSMREPNPKCYN